MNDTITADEDVLKYFNRVLPKILASLPLNTNQKIGIYGVGVHTDRLLEQYMDKVGEITADIVMIDSRRMSNTEKYHDYDIWNVKDIGILNLDAIILSSFLYEEELFKTIQKLYPGQFPIYRFYENKTEDIFLYKGIYIKPSLSEWPLLKVGFVDMWPSFCNGDNDVTRILDKKYNLKISDEPDILFCGQFGEKYKDYRNCKTVLWITEPFELHLNRYDYAFGYPYLNREGYLYYNTYAPRNCFIQYRDAFSDLALANRKFCNFIYSQDVMGEGAKLRKEFCIELGKYRHIDCPGRILNNMSGVIAPRYDKEQWRSKIAFLGQYKFTIAFENHKIPGYTTEKLWHAFWAGSIPIYWGNPMIVQDVNPEAFINCNDYNDDFDTVINRIKEINEDDKLYMSMLQHTPMKDTYDFSTAKLESFLDKIIN